jgi:hypothetical protein
VKRQVVMARGQSDRGGGKPHWLLVAASGEAQGLQEVGGRAHLCRTGGDGAVSEAQERGADLREPSPLQTGRGREEVRRQVVVSHVRRDEMGGWQQTSSWLREPTGGRTHDAELPNMVQLLKLR